MCFWAENAGWPAEAVAFFGISLSQSDISQYKADLSLYGAGIFPCHKTISLYKEMVSPYHETVFLIKPLRAHITEPFPYISQAFLYITKPFPHITESFRDIKKPVTHITKRVVYITKSPPYRQACPDGKSLLGTDVLFLDSHPPK